MFETMKTEMHKLWTSPFNADSIRGGLLANGTFSAIHCMLYHHVCVYYVCHFVLCKLINQQMFQKFSYETSTLCLVDNDTLALPINNPTVRVHESWKSFSRMGKVIDLEYNFSFTIRSSRFLLNRTYLYVSMHCTRINKNQIQTISVFTVTKWNKTKR